MRQNEHKILDVDRRVAEKVLAHMFEDARPASEFELDFVKDARSLHDYILGCDFRTFCILMISFTEDALRRNFINYWELNSKDKVNEYFGSNGPLSTFSQRVKVGVGIEWLTQEDGQQASLLRKIRNEFAHNHRLRTITEPPVVSWAEALRPMENGYAEAPSYVDVFKSASKETLLRMRVYLNAMSLIINIFSNAKLLSFHLPPHYKGGGDHSVRTEIADKLVSIMIRCAFYTLSGETTFDMGT